MNEEKSKCCGKLIRYLECEECKGTDKQCIYICSECGTEDNHKEVKQNEKENRI